MDAPALAIRTWRNDVTVAREHPAPERVRGEIDRITRSAAAELGAGLATYLEGQAGAVIFIRRLVFDCALDLQDDDRRLARHLAHRCARALVGAIESHDASVVRFASPAALRARFIVDLARGNARDHWYYRSFDGLAPLPAAAAIRTVLLDDAAVGRAALALVEQDAWPAVLSALTAAEARRALEGLAQRAQDERPDVAALSRWVAPACDALRRVAAGAPQNALLAFAVALRLGAAPDVATARAAELVGAIAARAPRTTAPTLAAAIVSGDAARWASLGEPFAALAAQLLRGPSRGAWCAIAAQAIQVLAPGVARAALVAAFDPAPFAGYALLLNEIDALLDAGLCAALPGADANVARGAAGLTVLALAAGPGRAGALWRDAAWRDFLGIAPRVSLADFAAALRATDRWAPKPPSIPMSERRPGRATRADLAALRDEEVAPTLPPRWRAVLLRCALLAWRRLARRIAGMRDASVAYLRVNFIAPRGEALREDADRWRWRLAPPQLCVLLNMSGVARTGCRWSAPRRAITLEFE